MVTVLRRIDLQDVNAQTFGLDREYIKQQMKVRYRNAWKTPGYQNEAFNPVLPLRPKVASSYFKVLTEWEYLRCLMPERSYKYYPEKGHLKVSHQSREFG